MKTTPYDLDRLDPLPKLGARSNANARDAGQHHGREAAQAPTQGRPVTEEQRHADERRASAPYPFGWQLPFLDTGFKRRAIDERFGSAM